jgi:hypothetical protein
MSGSRLLLVSGILGVALGAGGIFPLVMGWLGGGGIPRQGVGMLAVGLALIVGGIGVVGATIGRSRRAGGSVPAPVRAVMAANVLFLAFCAIELSDGWVYRGGRIFYWTSVLFAPALVVLYGHVLAQRWAWWVARGLAAIAVLWFVGFMFVIPFADLRANGVSAPWYGRLYMEGVTLVFASIAAYAFYSLGSAEARRYFGSAGEAEVAAAGE